MGTALSALLARALAQNDEGEGLDQLWDASGIPLEWFLLLKGVVGQEKRL